MNESGIALLTRAQEGDADATSRLVDENTGLVRSVAVRFMGRGVDYEDLCQIGHIGMLKAIRNFDLSRGTAFSTYAVPLIIGEIKRFLRDDGEIKVSRELKRRAALVYSARERFIARDGYEPSVSELSKLTELTEEETVEAIAASAKAISLSEHVGEDTVLEDLIGRDFSNEINEKIALKQAIDRLPREEREVIFLRYFKGLTQAEAGRALGMTQVTVSRREARALERLRQELK